LAQQIVSDLAARAGCQGSQLEEVARALRSAAQVVKRSLELGCGLVPETRSALQQDRGLAWSNRTCTWSDQWVAFTSSKEDDMPQLVKAHRRLLVKDASNVAMC